MKSTLSRTEPRITVRKIDGIDGYDIDNNYPKRVRDIVDNSGMGSTCLEMYIDHINGQGFENTDFAKAPINRDGLTPDELLGLICNDIGYIGGFCVHVNYNANFQFSEINYQCVDYLRFVNDRDKAHYGMYASYQDWCQRSIDKNKIIFIDKFNPDPNIIMKQVENVGGWNNYKGQILYFSNRLYQYPKAVYDAVLEDMQTDSKTKTFKQRNVTNSFLASHILFTDKFESTESDGRRNSEVDNFINNLRDFQGSEEAMKIMHVEKDTPDQTFELQKVEQQNGDTLFQQTENSVQNAIRKRFKIPSILLQEQASRLGATQEFIDATRYYNKITKKERLIIENVFRKLFSNFHEQINADDNYYILPQDPLERDDVERKNQIVQIVKDPTLTDFQKIEILVSLYGVPNEDAVKYINSGQENGGADKGSERDPNQLFNGIQTTSMITVVDAFKAGRLTSDEAKAILRISFRLNEEELNQVIGND